MLSCPGFSFASLTNSASDCAGRPSFTTRTKGVIARLEIGAIPLIGSYGQLG